MNSPARNRPLDVLRGAAILLVLGRHLPQAVTLIPGFLGDFYRIWYRIGWSGVDLFFVLSGFLVSGLLFKEYRENGAVRAKRFILRRGLRIWPAFYLMIALSVAFTWKTVRPDQIFSEVFFIQNYSTHPPMWVHTWTLAVEEHFYLLLAGILWLLAKRSGPNPFKAVPFLWLGASIGCLWYRFITPYYLGRVFMPTHARLDALLFGVMLAYFHHFQGKDLKAAVRRRWPWLLLAAAAGLSPIFRADLETSPFISRLGMTFTYLSYGMLLLVAVLAVPESKKTSPLEKFFIFIGIRSYSIYLWHFPVAWILVRPLSMAIDESISLGWAIAIYLTGAILVGCLSYRYIEQPILRWRDRHLL